LRFDSLTSFTFPLVSVGVLVRADAAPSSDPLLLGHALVKTDSAAGFLGNATPLLGPSSADGFGLAKTESAAGFASSADAAKTESALDALYDAAAQDTAMDPVFDAPPHDEHAPLVKDDEAPVDDEVKAPIDDDMPLAALAPGQDNPAGQVLASVSSVWSNQAIVQAATAPFGKPSSAPAPLPPSPSDPVLPQSFKWPLRPPLRSTTTSTTRPSPSRMPRASSPN
jgi:hypothetical protein